MEGILDRDHGLVEKNVCKSQFIKIILEIMKDFPVSLDGIP